MSLTVAVLMDPIEAIHIEKDSTFAMLLEAQRRGHRLLYLTQGGLALRDAAPWALASAAGRARRCQRLVHARRALPGVTCARST